MATGTRWTETAVELGGVKLHLARAGSGRSLLVLHHDIGSPERLDFYDALAGHFEVIVPHHPRIRPVRAAAMVAQCARRRGHVSMASRRSRRRAGFADRPRLWRMDRRRDGDDGTARVPPAGSGRGDGS